MTTMQEWHKHKITKKQIGEMSILPAITGFFVVVLYPAAPFMGLLLALEILVGMLIGVEVIFWTAYDRTLWEHTALWVSGNVLPH